MKHFHKEQKQKILKLLKIKTIEIRIKLNIITLRRLENKPEILDSPQLLPSENHILHQIKEGFPLKEKSQNICHSQNCSHLTLEVFS